MKKNTTGFLLLILLYSCGIYTNSNQEMVALLKKLKITNSNVKNFFASEAKLAFYDSLLQSPVAVYEHDAAVFYKAETLLELGNEKESIEQYEMLLKKATSSQHKMAIKRGLAIAYMRLGERVNCLYNHTGSSCVFPIMADGVHVNKTGSTKAIALYEEILAEDSTDIESRWLLNIAYMTLGRYPEGVPRAFLLPGLNSDTLAPIKPFADIAINTGLNTTNLAGGNIVDDFNNDGYFDIITSGWDLSSTMHYCKNNGDGTFSDVSVASGLHQFTGGLNIIQTDYNNDGWKDIFVLRGGWKKEFGAEPNSLLRNNGDGTFTDVTVESGLLSFHPTQTATWADFNNDGWLDVFIGNEQSMLEIHHPCELYINNGNGTFRNIAYEAGVQLEAFVKGVASGDYNNDGWMDIIVSTMNGTKSLLKNDGLKNGSVHFTDVSKEAGFRNNTTSTFATWFWDYNNDGWLDVLFCNYSYRGSLAPYFTAEALGYPNPGNAGKVLLYENNHDGTFTDVSEKRGLNKIAFAMGSNFGDIDNDGFPDIYLGTGNPDYKSLVPNKMFKNNGGVQFYDVTTSARVGNLQKGHGVAFADIDNDGDMDIYLEAGGAFKGDAYQNSLYINPGQNNNSWIDINVQGVDCNRAAIGAKIKLFFKENGIDRIVYKEVNSGGSFGASPLRQHLGIGSASVIDSIEIIWPGSTVKQVLKNVKPNQYITVKQNVEGYKTYVLKTHDFTLSNPALVSCGPL